MKKHGLLNSDISKVLADLGHTDQIIIADCGLPIPNEVKKIDLSLKIGNPSFIEVLKTVLEDMEVEKIILAKEIKSENRELNDEIEQVFQTNIEKEYITHEEFKKEIKNVKAVVRTGEATPYANVILQAGVIF